ncbi:MAG: CotH kinase family protein [Saprospiraceae bacterium]|nr:CotH kinase family protein [Saprospiraceae bacterium]
MTNRILIISLAFAAATAARAQDFYDVNTIQDIKITFYQQNWDAALDSLKNVDEQAFLLVPSVEINGEVFDSVGVKYKGNSSYDKDFLKNPLSLELDLVRKDQNYHGIDDVKLTNAFADPTFVREIISYEILHQYMDEPRANFARIWMNGVYWGVYINTESINKRFLRNNLHTDGDNPFFKCNPADLQGPGSGINRSDLVYSSADSAFYYDKYELRSDYGWYELLALMDSITNHPANIHKILDVDRALWMLAFNNVFVNLDSYTGVYAQNYYLYWDKNDRWLPIIWDLNMSFAAFPNLDGSDLLSIPELKVLDPLAQSDNFFRPLIKNLLANPTYKRMYLAHMRTMLQENIATDAYRDRAIQLQGLIDADVLTDQNKFYTYDDFHNNVDQIIFSFFAFGDVPGLSNLMDDRYNYLTTHPLLTPTPPSISNVSATTTGAVWVNAQVQNASAVTLGWRYDSSDVFKKISMFDDGQHQDGAAGDGVYGASFPVGDIKGQYYVYAENAGAGMFSPERAEHEFYQTPTLPPLPNIGDLVINEFLADNVAGEKDEAGQYDDWLELYNNSNAPISLTGIYLSDNPNNPDKWSFPTGVSIPAKGFLIVWLDEDQSQGAYHANFRLNAGGEFLMLSNGAGTVLDSLSYGQQKTDTTYGRYPNGTGDFTFMPRTFNAPNSLTSSAQEPGPDATFDIHPNPANEMIRITAEAPIGVLRISDMQGRQVYAEDFGNARQSVQDVGSLADGVYFLSAGQGGVRLLYIQR